MESLRLSTGRWFNKQKTPGKWAKAPAYYSGFTYDNFTYGTDHPESEGFVTETQLQVSIICSRTTSLLAIDVDYPDNLPNSAVGALVTAQDAISMHGDHFHILVDMRGATDWPQQGRTLWGDIKSSGFIPLPGSEHWSGDFYAAAPNWQARVVAATPELIEALKSDRRTHAEARMADAHLKNPHHQGTKDTAGRHIYASGYVDSTSDQLPDGFLEHDDELKDLVYDLGTRNFPVDAVFAEWRRLAGSSDPGHPWTDKDFERHWKRVPEIAAEQQAIADEEESGWLSIGMDPAEVVEREQSRRADIEAAQVRHEANPYEPSLLGPESEAPEDSDEPELPPVNKALMKHWLGDFSFEPTGVTDNQDAEALLQRVWTVSRYCPMQDTWLARRQDRWIIHPGDMSEGVVGLPVDLELMPEGRSEAQLKKDDLSPDDKEYKDDLRRWKKFQKFGNANDAGKIARKIRARMKSPLPHPMHEDLLKLDQDPTEFWAGGACWDLRASVSGPVRKETPVNEVHLHSATCAPVAMPRDEMPLWTGLLDAVWPPVINSDGSEDRSLQEFALTCLAVGLTGDAKKILPMLRGGTDCGKTTTIDAIMDLLGSYASPLNPKAIDAAANTHDTILMELMGKRLMFLDEGLKQGQYSIARLKRLVGGSKITANRMRKDPVTFAPTHTMVLALNPGEKPPFTDAALVSRIRYIPCEGDPAAVIAAAKKLNHYKSPAWHRERPGVLAELIQYAARGLNNPQVLAKENAPLQSQMAEQAAIEEQDTVLRWFMEATADCPEGFPSRELYKAYAAWTGETESQWKILEETSWGLRMNELVPGDPKKTSAGNKRHRKPLTPGAYPMSPIGNPMVSQFMNTPTRPVSARVEPSIPSTLPSTYITPGQVASSGGYGGYGGSTTSHTHTPTHTHVSDEPVEGSIPSIPSTVLPLALDPAISPWPPAGQIENPPSAPKAPEQQNGDTPPISKTPSPAKPAKKPAKRPKMTPEERQEALEAKRAETARAKAEKLAATLLELGGPLVRLPAIVLRDQTIIPVTCEQAFDFLVPFMNSALGIDVEHTGYAIGHDNYALRLVQLGGESGAVVFDPSDRYQAEVIKTALSAAQKLHAHSALADLIPSEHAGLCDASVWDKMVDTVNLAKLINPSLTDSDEAALKPLAKNVLGADYAVAWKCDKLKAEIFKSQGWLVETELLTPIEKSGWAQIPICEAFVRYAASDVLDCNAVARLLEPQLAPELVKREQQFAKAFRPIALYGTPLDEPKIDLLIEAHERGQEAARLRVEVATQGAITLPTSTTQVPLALVALGYNLPRTKPTKTKPEGGISAAKGVLEPLAGNILDMRELYEVGEVTLQELTNAELKYDPLCADILEYRKHSTALGLLLRPWKSLCTNGDGRVRSNIMTIEARTGRTSSRGFNMQQVNRRGGMRACIKPEIRCKGISADFNSVEVRVGAGLSGDEQMQYLIAQGDLYPDRKKEFDFHWRTAITCYGESATKENRYNSKRINFAKMFGSGKQSCANLVGVPVHEVSMAFDAFSAIAPQYEAWDTKMREYVKNGGRSFEAYSGRPLWMDPDAEWGAGNTAIQGTARELAVDATLKWQAGPWGHLTLLIVHDELCVWNVPEDEAEAATAELVRCMETSIFGVQIRAEANEPWDAWPDAS